MHVVPLVATNEKFRSPALRATSLLKTDEVVESIALCRHIQVI